MLISYNWLRSFISISAPVEEVIARLIQAGVAVESVKHLGRDITNVVVAELLSVEKHPQADRLSLTKVSDGKETYQVVCGAKNIAPGQKVPLAKIGAILPGNFEIKAAKIRAVESFGMLCSAKELGLAGDAEGILILPPDATLGQNFLTAVGLPDTLFELEITPNRADLLSHLGVAREIGSIFHQPIHLPKIKKNKESSIPLSKLARISIEAKDLCHLYACRVIEGLQVGHSPKWLSQTLERLGQKSINNVVDITNYVLHEMGQPLHAFDLTQLHGRQIIVRRATSGEKIPLLDNTERELKEEMLIIADAERPIALAGIMGGSNSQVTDKTQSILLEAALFSSGSVRKTARQMGISTDSSYRFERGVDPEGIKAALERASSLMIEIAGGQMAKGMGWVATKALKPTTVTYRPQRANTILGLDLSTKQQITVLKALGCRIKGTPASKTLGVQSPTYRLDLTREIDFIEEIARLTGYDKIPTVAASIPSNLLSAEPGIPFENEIRSVFHQSGFYEAVNSTFLPLTFPQKLRLSEDHSLRRFREVVNPIADDQKVLRPTLLPSLLSNVQLNLSHQQEKAALYEINKVFSNGDDHFVSESPQAAAILAGTSEDSGWHKAERSVDFYDIKGIAENILGNCALAVPEWEFGSCSTPYRTPQSFQILDSKGSLLMLGGELDPKVLKEYDISAPCFSLEIMLDNLQKAPQRPRSYVPLPKFPSAWRDIALVVPDGVTSAQVMAAIAEKGAPQLRNVRLFDLYRGPNLPSGFRSLAYRLQFLNEERTLTDQEVTEKVSQVTDHLKSRYSIALR